MAEVSQNSLRVARNTLLLYMRMLLMMVIGLFTSRIVLQALGVDDFGTYTVVYEMVMLFSIVSNSVSNAISRFMAFEIGRGDEVRQRKVFSSAMIIQTMMSLALAVLVATVGLWYLRTKMVLPSGNADAAMWVMICTAGIMVVQLYSIPYNATIIAHEDMKAFAYISILEAVLKLSVALSVRHAGSDRLVLYALLMLAVAVITRAAYSAYSHRRFSTTRGRWSWDWDILKQMLSFSGWGLLGNGVAVINTKGVSMLSNSFFGVGINAARGIALQVENIIKQFVTNFLTALNPQITKSWSAGSMDYCHHLVCKGCKFSYLMMLLFVVPFAFESEMILDLWLEDVPAYAASFTRLTLVCLLMDMMANSLFQLVLAGGKVSRYYITTSALMTVAFAATWFAFACGAVPQSSYLVLMAAYLAVDILKLFFAHRECGLPYGLFLKEVALPCAAVSAAALAVCGMIWWLMSAGWLRLLLILTAGTIAMSVTAYGVAFTDGEREFVRGQLSRLLHFRTR